MGKVVILGCGFVGARAARSFAEAGWEVIGVTHTEESAQKLAGEPFRVFACDITVPEALRRQPELMRANVLISAVSSGRGDADVYRSVYLEGLRNATKILQPQAILFVSSTSVYAQCDGEWVSEENPADPQRETGKVLREAEEFALKENGSVARLAGIYGPGRWMLLQKFLEGRAMIEGDGQRFLNQIHADDAASALVHLIMRNAPRGIYNVADDAPMTQRDVYTLLAEHFRKSLPPSGPIDHSRKRGWTNKRVSNRKLRATGWAPRFPSIREALEAFH